jgi:hypothetical protein
MSSLVFKFPDANEILARLEVLPGQEKPSTKAAKPKAPKSQKAITSPKSTRPRARAVKAARTPGLLLSTEPLVLADVNATVAREAPVVVQTRPAIRLHHPAGSTGSISAQSSVRPVHQALWSTSIDYLQAPQHPPQQEGIPALRRPNLVDSLGIPFPWFWSGTPMLPPPTFAPPVHTPSMFAPIIADQRQFPFSYPDQRAQFNLDLQPANQRVNENVTLDEITGNMNSCPDLDEVSIP